VYSVHSSCNTPAQNLTWRHLQFASICHLISVQITEWRRRHAEQARARREQREEQRLVRSNSRGRGRGGPYRTERPGRSAQRQATAGKSLSYPIPSLLRPSLPTSNCMIIALTMVHCIYQQITSPLPVEKVARTKALGGMICAGVQRRTRRARRRSRGLWEFLSVSFIQYYESCNLSMFYDYDTPSIGHDLIQSSIFSRTNFCEYKEIVALHSYSVQVS
jgi:hypothetical protein